MKINNYAIRLIISLITVIMFSGNATAQDEPSKTINGIWVGTLVIPNNAELRMGITVSESNKASLNIIDQATGNIPIDEVIMHGDSVVFKMNGLGITISCLADLDHNRLTGEFNQHGTVFPMIFERNEKMPELNRPQLPKEPFPYTAEEVTYENRAEGILLAGTLTLPETGNKAPAVILLTGTGQQGRDQDVGGHKPFWVIADYLSRNGIAVLRIDDRGIGGSKGNFDRSTTGNFAQDALAGIAYLKTRSEINADQIGLIGHSEGGITAAIAASISKEVAFMISLAGPGLNFEDIVIGQISDQLKQQGVGEDDIRMQAEWRRKIYAVTREPVDSANAAKKLWELHGQLSGEDIKRMNWPAGRQAFTISQILSPWWRFSLGLDNRSLYRNVTCPVLALFGEKDTQVRPLENSQIVESALKEGGNRNYEVTLVPGLNHLFQTAETGSEYEYVRIEQTFSPDVLARIRDWIMTVTGN